MANPKYIPGAGDSVEPLLYLSTVPGSSYERRVTWVAESTGGWQIQANWRGTVGFLSVIDAEVGDVFAVAHDLQVRGKR